MPYQPWHRRKQESREDYALFQKYYNLPLEEQRLSVLSARIDVDMDTLEDIAIENRWERRLDAYNAAQLAKELSTVEDREIQIKTMEYAGLTMLHNRWMEFMEEFDPYSIEYEEEIDDPDPDYEGQRMRVVTRRPDLRGFRSMIKAHEEIMKGFYRNGKIPANVSPTKEETTPLLQQTNNNLTIKVARSARHGDLSSADYDTIEVLEVSEDTGPPQLEGGE